MLTRQPVLGTKPTFGHYDMQSAKSQRLTTDPFQSFLRQKKYQVKVGPFCLQILQSVSHKEDSFIFCILKMVHGGSHWQYGRVFQHNKLKVVHLWAPDKSSVPFPHTSPRISQRYVYLAFSTTSFNIQRKTQDEAFYAYGTFHIVVDHPVIFPNYNTASGYVWRPFFISPVAIKMITVACHIIHSLEIRRQNLSWHVLSFQFSLEFRIIIRC